MKLKLRIFSWHLSASSVLALLAAALVFGIWYPDPLHQALGVTTIFLMLLAVHVIIGPLLTLIVSKEGKKTFKLDMTVIILLQLAAFIFGMKVIAEGRPVWIVFSSDRFNVVQAYELETNNKRDLRSLLKRFSFTGPKWVGIRLPDDAKELNQFIFGPVSGGGEDLYLRPHLYAPLEESYTHVQKKALPLGLLNQYNPPELVQQTLKKWPEADAFLPLRSRAQPMTVLVRRSTGEVIAVVPLKPWQ